MSFPTYAHYKDSGVEWLGEVPAHWDVTRLKFVASVQTGMAKGKEYGDKETLVVPYLRVANVQDGYLALDDLATMEIPAAELDRYRLQPGDVLMNEGGDFDKLGRGHVWQGEIEPCIHQNHVFAVRPIGVSPRWLNAYTGSNAAQFYFMTRSKQSTNLASISSTNIMELPLPAPSAQEQELILSFLERETSKLDALITEQRTLIDLLKEKRQAVISHAVTKGLDPRVPMKDSGVECLGDVPAHWDLMPLKHLTAPGRDIMYGIVLPGPCVEEGIPIVKGGDVKPGRLKRDLLNRTTPEIEAPFARARLLPKDIVYSIRGSIGDAEVVPEELAGANITQDVARISPAEHIDSTWLLKVMKSWAIFAQLESRTSGATIRGINIFDLKRPTIPVPPIHEQQAISEHLTENLSRLDALTAEAQTTIALLQERRSALISAAVTGKIDVRGT